MASLTKKTKSIRSRKRARAGSARKKALELKGSTPSFAIHKPGAKKAQPAAKQDESAVKKAKPAAKKAKPAAKKAKPAAKKAKPAAKSAKAE